MITLDERIDQWIEHEQGTAGWEQKLKNLFHQEIQRERDCWKKKLEGFEYCTECGENNFIAEDLFSQPHQ